MLSALRAVLGPSFALLRSIPAVPPDPERPPRLDVEVAITHVDDDAWTVSLAVPPYGLETHNLLSEVRVYVVPQGHGLPASAADYVASSYPYASVALRSSLGGLNVTLPLPEVDEGRYFGQSVLLFQDDATEPDPAPSDDPSPNDSPPTDAPADTAEQDAEQPA